MHVKFRKRGILPGKNGEDYLPRKIDEGGWACKIGEGNSVRPILARKNWGGKFRLPRRGSKCTLYCWGGGHCSLLSPGTYTIKDIDVQ